MRHLPMGVGRQHHRGALQPGSRAVGDDGVLGDHESQAGEPQIQAVGQLQPRA